MSWPAEHVSLDDIHQHFESYGAIEDLEEIYDPGQAGGPNRDSEGDVVFIYKTEQQADAATRVRDHWVRGDHGMKAQVHAARASRSRHRIQP